MVFKIFLPTKKFCRLATSTCRLCNPVVYVSPSIQVYQPPFFCKNLSTKYKQHTKRTKATSYHKQGYKLRINLQPEHHNFAPRCKFQKTSYQKRIKTNHANKPNPKSLQLPETKKTAPQNPILQPKITK